MNAIQTLTESQKRALVAYGDFVRTHGFLPSTREFCEAYGVSSSSTGFAALQTLRDKGFPCHTRVCGHFSKGQQGREEIAKAIRYFLDFSPQEGSEEIKDLIAENTRLRSEMKELERIKSENQSLTKEVVSLRSKLAAVQRWVIYSDRKHGVQKVEPHDWKTPVGRRVELLVALGEIKP